MPRTRLSSEAAAEARQVVSQMVAAGKSQEEVDKFIADFKAQQAGKITPPTTQTGAPEGDAAQDSTDLASGAGSSDSLLKGETEGEDETWGKFVKDKQGRRFYRDHEGDINAISGEVGAMIQSVPFFGDVIDDIYGAYKQGRAQARAVDDSLGLFAKGADISDEDLQTYIARANEMNNTRVSDDMKEFNAIYEEANGGAWGFIKAISLRPQAALETIVSSLVAMANPATIAGGAAGAATTAATGAALSATAGTALGPVGTAVGGALGGTTGAIAGFMGGMSATLDTAMSYSEFLQEEVGNRGLEFNEDGIREVLSDPEALSRIRARSAGRGLTVGLVDGLTAGIAGKVGASVTKTALAAGKTAKKAAIKGATRAFGVEAAGGGIGETAARLVAGQELDAREIGLEIVGEFGQGAGIVARSVQQGLKGRKAKQSGDGDIVVEETKDTTPFYEVNGQQLSDEDFATYLNEHTPTEIGSHNVTVKNNPALEEAYLERKTGIKEINKGNDLLPEGHVDTKNGIIGNLESVDRQINEAKAQGRSTTQLTQIRKEISSELKAHRRLEKKIISKIPAEQRSNLISLKQEAASIDQDLQNLPDDPQNDVVRTKLQERSDIINSQIGDIIIPAETEATSETVEKTIDQEEEAQAVSKEREEFDGLVGEDLDKSSQKFDGIESGFAKTLRITGSGRPASREDANVKFPITKSGESFFTEGDFVKKVQSIAPMTEGEANETLINLKKQAKAANFDVNVEAVPAGDGNVNIVGEITAKPREKSVYQQMFEGKSQEAAPVEGEVEAEAETGEEVLTPEQASEEAYGLAQKEAASTDRSRGGEVYEGAIENTPEAIVYPGIEDQAEAKKAGVFATKGSLRNSGYPKADIKYDEGGVSIVKGPYEPKARVAEKARFSISEPKALKLSKPGGFAKERIEATFGSKKGEAISAPDFTQAPGTVSEINLGFENNPLDYKQALERLNSDPRITIGTHEEVVSDTEPTLVAKIKFDGTKTEYEQFLKELADETGQDAIAGKYHGEGTLIHGTSPRENWGDFNEDYYKSPTKKLTPVSTPEIAGQGGYKVVDGNLSVDGVDINEGDLIQTALPGQSYVKIGLHEENTETRAANVGGKSGFGGAVDKEAQSKIVGSGETKTAADHMKILEDAFSGKQPKKTKGVDGSPVSVEAPAGEGLVALGTEAFRNINTAIRKLTPYGITPKYLNSSKGLTAAMLDEIRDNYDILMGYKNAHKNLDNKFRLGIVNDLNLGLEGKVVDHKRPKGEVKKAPESAVDRDLTQSANWNNPLAVISQLTGYKILAEADGPQKIDEIAHRLSGSENAIPSFGTGFGTLNKRIKILNNLKALIRTAGDVRAQAVALRDGAPIPPSAEHISLSRTLNNFKTHNGRNLLKEINDLRRRKTKVDALKSEGKIAEYEKALESITPVARELGVTLGKVEGINSIPEVTGFNSLFEGSLARERAVKTRLDDEISELKALLHPSLSNDVNSSIRSQIKSKREQKKSIDKRSLTNVTDRSLIDAFIADAKVQDAEKAVTDKLINEYQARPVDPGNRQEQANKKAIEDRTIHTFLRLGQYWAKDVARKTGREVRTDDFGAGFAFRGQKGKALKTEYRKGQTQKQQEFELARSTREQLPDILQVAHEVISLAVKEGKIPQDYSAYIKNPSTYSSFKSFHPADAKEAITALKLAVKDSISEYYEGEGRPAGKAKTTKQDRADIKTVKAAQDYLSSENIYFNEDGTVETDLGSRPNDPIQIRAALLQGFKTKRPADGSKATGTKIKGDLSEDRVSEILELSGAFPKSQRQSGFNDKTGEAIDRDLIEEARGTTVENLQVGLEDARKGVFSKFLIPKVRLESIIDRVKGIVANRPVQTDQETGITGPKAKRDINAKVEADNKAIDKNIRRAISEGITASKIRGVDDAILVNGDQVSLKDISDFSGKSIESLKNSFFTAQSARDIKSKLSEFLAPEIEAQATPEARFQIEPGSRTFTTDTGKQTKSQVNSEASANGGRRLPWAETAKEMNNLIRKTDFDNDHVQWVVGDIFNDARGDEKGIPTRIRELMRKDIPSMHKLLRKRSQELGVPLELRQDTIHKGMYHVYKKGGPGDFNVKASISESKASTTVADKSFNDRVIAALSKAWPDINASSTPEAWAGTISGLRMSGFDVPRLLKGLFLPGENKVRINPKSATMDTGIHEFAHIWANKLMRDNPKLWKRGKELLKGSEYVKSILQIPEYKAYLKDSPSLFWEEAMANAIGKRGAVLFQSKANQSAWDKFISNFSKWIKGKLNIASKNDYADLTLADWIDAGVEGTFSGDTFAQKSSQPRFSVAEGKAKVLSDIEKSRAQETAMEATKGQSVLERFSNWFVGPANDDFHGLVERYKAKFDDETSKGLDKLTELYEKGYESYEKAASGEGGVRETIDNATNALTESLGIKKSALNNKLAEDSPIIIDGSPISYNQAMAIYSDRDNKLLPKSVVDGVTNKLPSEMKKFVDSVPFKIEADGTIQKAEFDYINKDLLKQHLRDFISLKNASFSKKQVNAIGSKIGDGYSDALNNSLERMAGVTKPEAQGATKNWSDWLQNSVGTIMFLNFRSAGLQLLSLANYATPGNMFGFAKELFTPSNKPLFKELWNDPMLKERRSRAGFDVNADEIFAGMAEGKFSGSTSRILKAGFITTSFVDSLAIAGGGMAYISQGLKDGTFKNKAEALSSWRSKTQEAQQSSRPDRVSKEQKAPISKLVLAFANTPQQYFRLSQKAYRVIKAKGLGSKEGRAAAVKIGYYMAIQNAIFTALQAGMWDLLKDDELDDKDRKRIEDGVNSMSDTILRGMGLYGAVASAAKNVARNAYYESEKVNPDYGKSSLKGAVGVAPPLSRKINDLLAIGSTYKYDKDKKGVRHSDYVAGSRALTTATNLPFDWVQKKAAAVQLLINDEANFAEFLQMLGGYSEYAVLGKGKKKSGLGKLELGELNLDKIKLDKLEF